MPRVIVQCPDCGRRLETAWDNVGRDGLCPACEGVFPIALPWTVGLPGTASVAAPYRGLGALSATLALAACLVLVVLSIAADWVQPAGPAAALAVTQKALFAGVSAACLGFLLACAAARTSFVPGLLVLALWSAAAGVWSGGLVSCLLGAAGSGTVRGPLPGLYFSLVAVCAIAAASAYAFAQHRRACAVPCSWSRYAVAVGTGALLGLFVVAAHVRPGCYALAAPATRHLAGPEYTLALDNDPRPQPRRSPDEEPAQKPKDTPERVDTEPDAPEATPVQRAPDPAQPDPPSEPPEPVQPPPERCKYILIEGEAAERQDCERPGVYTDVDRSLLSGNGWLSHMPARPERKARASYTFVVDDQGAYRWWIRLTPLVQGTLRYRLDGSPWQRVRAVNTLPDDCGRGSAHVVIGWVRCDLSPKQSAFSLSAGTHRLELEFSKVAAGKWTAVDCMMFTPAPCQPAGIGRPEPVT